MPNLRHIEESIRRNYPSLYRQYSNPGAGNLSKILKAARNREMVQIITLYALAKTDFFQYAAFYCPSQDFIEQSMLST